MAQHGQVLKLRTREGDGKAVWAFRYRVNGRRSKRPQVGGFATRAEAERALRRTLDRLRPGVKPATCQRQTGERGSTAHFPLVGLTTCTAFAFDSNFAAAGFVKTAGVTH